MSSFGGRAFRWGNESELDEEGERLMELVSVIIPTHNRVQYLPAAIASVFGQTHPEVEVIVVDDASEDETPQILAQLAEEEPRLKLIRHEKSGGAPRARNAGAGAARGGIIAFLDDDCVFHPEKTERQLRLLAPDRGVVYCQQMIRQVGGGWEVEGAAGANEKPLEGLLSIGTNTLLLRRDLFEAAGGFDEDLPRLQDWELLLRLARRTSFAYAPEILVQGVMVSGGITLTPGPMARAAERIVERHSPHLDSQMRSLLHFILGKFLLVDGLTKEAQRFMASALRLKPWSLRNWAGLIVSFLGPKPARAIRGWRRQRPAEARVEPWAPTNPDHAPNPKGGE
jgi:glycosyltransferase involved in cell wall biosynthesis